MTKQTHRNLWNESQLDYDNLYDEYTFHKDVILYLDSLGYNRTEIGTYLGKTPQHISNTLNVKNVSKDHDNELAKYRKNKKTS